MSEGWPAYFPGRAPQVPYGGGGAPSSFGARPGWLGVPERPKRGSAWAASVGITVVPEVARERTTSSAASVVAHPPWLAWVCDRFKDRLKFTKISGPRSAGHLKIIPLYYTPLYTLLIRSERACRVAITPSCSVLLIVREAKCAPGQAAAPAFQPPAAMSEEGPPPAKPPAAPQPKRTLWARLSGTPRWPELTCVQHPSTTHAPNM